MIVFDCPCGRRVKAPDAAAGKNAPCPACRRPLTVPVSQPAPRPGPILQSVPAPQRRGWRGVRVAAVVTVLVVTVVAVVVFLLVRGEDPAKAPGQAKNVPAAKPQPRAELPLPTTKETFQKPPDRPPPEKPLEPVETRTEQPGEKPKLPDPLSEKPKASDPAAKQPDVSLPVKKADEARLLRRFVIWQGEWNSGPPPRWIRKDEKGRFYVGNLLSGTAFAPDRRTLAATYASPVFHLGTTLPVKAPTLKIDYDEHVTLWDVDAGKPIRRLKPAADLVPRFASDMAKNLKNQELTSAIADPRGPAFAPDGKQVLTIHGRDRPPTIFLSDAALRVWDTASGDESAGRTPTRTRNKLVYPTSLACAAFTPAGDQIVTGSDDPTLIDNSGNDPTKDPDHFSLGVLDRSLKGPERRLPGHAAPVAVLAFSPDGRHVFSGSGNSAVRRNLKLQMEEEACVRQWSLATGLEVRRFTGLGGAVACLAVSPDGKGLLIGGHDSKVRWWDLATGALIRKFATPPSRPTCFDFSKDGSLVLIGAQAHVLIHEVATGKEVLRVRACRDHPVFPGLTNAAFSSDNRRALIVVLGERAPDEKQDTVFVEEWELPL